MSKYSTKFILVLLIGFLAFSIPEPEVQAMEPISIAMMLAPIVIPIVKAAIPYILKGMVNMGGAMFEVGVEMFRMSYLMLGFVEVTFGAPFGLFSAGVANLAEGAMAFPKSMLLMLAVFPKTVGLM